MELIDKATVVVEIENLRKHYIEREDFDIGWNMALDKILSFLDTLEVKEVGLTDSKTDWSPSKKQMESLKDMLKWNIGDFNYQKWMEVNSLYDDLTKILDYETDR